MATIKEREIPCVFTGKTTVLSGSGFTIFAQKCFRYIGAVVLSQTSRPHPVMNISISISI